LMKVPHFRPLTWRELGEAVLIVIGIMTIVALSGCTRAVAPNVTVIYNVQPIDPPMQPVNERDCFAFGFDGLACRELGLRI
jgi:hypothetical protein